MNKYEYNPSENENPIGFRSNEFSPMESKPTEFKPRECRTNEFNHIENKPDEFKPREYRPHEFNPMDSKPDEFKHREYRPNEINPMENKHGEIRPREYGHNEINPMENKHGEFKHREYRPNEISPMENKPDEIRPIEYSPLHHSPNISMGAHTVAPLKGRTTKALAMALVILIIGMGLAGIIGFYLTSGPPDADGDGVPDEDDIFPDDEHESQDSDGDGTGDNGDPDDDNDGVPDDQDAFPHDANESLDTDLDGVGNNADPDDDNDGFNDTDDLDPLHDLALSFNFTWVNLTVPLNKKATTRFQFEIQKDGVRLKLFDNNGRPWDVPWEERYNLTTSFEVNVPDNITTHEFTIRAYQVKWFRGSLLDISDSNESYEGVIRYNLSNGNLSSPLEMILNGSLDNMTDEPDAVFALTVGTFHFGYLKSYSWYFEGTTYTMSYNFDPADYAFYSTRNHDVRTYDDYITFTTPDDPALQEFTALLFDRISGFNLSDLQEAQYILNFVQALKYAEDNVTTGIGEYPRFPVETLVDQMGDCEDTALLAITIAEIRGIESALILLYEAFSDAGHAAPAFAVNGSGSHYSVGEVQFFYGESTGSGWKIGEMPEFNSTKAYVYEVP